MVHFQNTISETTFSSLQHLVLGLALLCYFFTTIAEAPSKSCEYQILKDIMVSAYKLQLSHYSNGRGKATHYQPLVAFSALFLSVSSLVLVLHLMVISASWEAALKVNVLNKKA